MHDTDLSVDFIDLCITFYFILSSFGKFIFT